MVQLAAALLLAALLVAQQPQTPPLPTFRSSVEVTTVDVTVVDNAGRPLADLQPADFTVRIDGRVRRAISAQWVPLTRPVNTPPPPPPPDGVSTNEHDTAGRLIVIAIDQPNIRSDGVLGVNAAVGAFIDQLEPSDRIAAVALGYGVSTPFTADRAMVKEAVSHMSGDMRSVADMSTYSVAATEAIEIADGNQGTLQVVVGRECLAGSGRGASGGPACRQQIIQDSQAMAGSLKQEADRTFLSLHGLLDSLKKIDAPKTLVLVSEGFVVTGGDDPVRLLGTLAAAARTTMYALKIDDSTMNMANKRPANGGDRQLRRSGLDRLASFTRGDVFDVLGVGSAAFERLEREISGYYLVGVESSPTDTDGKAHPITVQVTRRGAVVRARREFTNAAVARAGAPNPLEAVSTALSSPLMVPGLPLHVATFALRDDNASRIQVLIHLDVGNDYTSARPVTLGYIISDRNGNIVVNQLGDGRLAPTAGLPSPLVYTVAAALDPGEYMLKVAVAEGGRVGSVEHPVHARLIDAGPLTLSELIIGGPSDAQGTVHPSISYDVSAGVQGYMEAYGASENLLMRYEVAPSLEAPSLLNAVVPGRAATGGRTIFSYVMPVRELPPGQYYLRAILTTPGASFGTPPLKRMARAFRVVPAPAGAAMRTPPPPSAGTAPTASAPAANTPAATVISARPFRREEAMQAETLQQFRNTLSQSARPGFDAGVAALASGDYVKAEQSFKAALQGGAAGGNSTAPLTYLAATYAASGHDLEASNVWQNALIEGSEYSQIYAWLADALIRVRSVDQARAILREAVEKWPGDTRFAERLAALQGAAQGDR